MTLIVAGSEADCVDSQGRTPLYRAAAADADGRLVMGLGAGTDGLRMTRRLNSGVGGQLSVIEDMR